MKHIYALFLLVIGVHSLTAQSVKPVSWKFSAVHVEGSTYDLVLRATIAPHWHIYGQDLDPGGPIATSVTFDAGDQYTLEGSTSSSENLKTVLDPIFEMTVSKFSEYAEFKQRIAWKDTSKPVTGYVTFMACDQNRCLPPSDVSFRITTE